ncbi:hypothetical protein DPQ33_17675 [Oceanidesulfovibrio indonesiensis]|uniref:Uncharacterized protein n=1 Tax=Oceanidesulfovibrio indonesiensis TaxID=54767 RepID=A0A7M3MAU5_9BACT|nr:hypothetical protein [Oceanidesulfovibrio indonesiensis]TVM14224.1 hypothetical protein DPQ33_17675 [Oceanidesulfovibrio indonesiensis]
MLSRKNVLKVVTLWFLDNFKPDRSDLLIHALIDVARVPPSMLANFLDVSPTMIRNYQSGAELSDEKKVQLLELLEIIIPELEASYECTKNYGLDDTAKNSGFYIGKLRGFRKLNHKDAEKRLQRRLTSMEESISLLKEIVQFQRKQLEVSSLKLDI